MRVNSIVAKLEAEGYIAVSAKPAQDLHTAQDFYEKNQFEVVRVVPGVNPDYGILTRTTQ